MNVFTRLNGQNSSPYYKSCSLFAKTSIALNTYFSRKSQIGLGIKVVLITILLATGVKNNEAQAQACSGYTVWTTGMWIGPVGYNCGPGGANGVPYYQTVTYNGKIYTHKGYCSNSGPGTWDFLEMGSCSVGGVLPVTFTGIAAAVNTNKTHTVKWFASNEVNLEGYVIERSANGVRFDVIGDAPVAGNMAYSFIDASPLADVNYYRVRATSANGQVVYSAIVKLSNADVKPSFTILPNPVVNKTMHINFQKMEGLYSISVINKQGATVFTKQITLAAGSQVKDIAFGEAVAAGVYNVILVDAKGKRSAQTIFVQ
jgi:hypothetical protein